MSITIQAPAPRKSINHAHALRQISTGVGCAHAPNEATHQPKRPRQAVNVSLIDDIVSDGLRRAAMARTYMEALDITGAALLAVAAVARIEGRYTAA